MITFALLEKRFQDAAKE